MATGTMLAFDHTALLIMNNTVDLANDTLRVRLLEAVHTDASTTAAASLGTASSNLDSNNKALSSLSVTQTGTDEATFDAADLQFTASGGSSTVGGFVIYDDTTASPLDAVLFYGGRRANPAT